MHDVTACTPNCLTCDTDGPACDTGKCTSGYYLDENRQCNRKCVFEKL